ncbi:MAG: hypothetical protein NVSMB57_11980 [Actinomycetota bacterium]
MRYAAYDELDGRPNVIVDGFASRGTVLVLSHWPGAGSPEVVADDLSTQMAFRYLETPSVHVSADLVSNNHFDEDGLCGIYALLHPEDALARKAALIDVASAGDFATWRNRDSARIAMALTAFADPDRSPLALSGQPYTAQTKILYEHLLPRLPALLDDPEAVGDLWAEDDARLQRTLDALERGAITIEEKPEIDLAVVRVPDGEAPHDMAIFNATNRFRVLTLQDGMSSLRYRYESWVRYRSRPVMPRVSLAPLAKILSDKDGAAWISGSIDELTPALRPRSASSIKLDELEGVICQFLEGSVDFAEAPSE